MQLEVFVGRELHDVRHDADTIDPMSRASTKSMEETIKVVFLFEISGMGKTRSNMLVIYYL